MSSTSGSPPPDFSQFRHTPYYCEENVYFLCKSLCQKGIAKPDGSDLFVVFISNNKKQVPLWHQKASHRADGVILWDYHAICVQRKQNSPHLVWDLDSSLPFPSPLGTYVSETIRPSFQLFSEYQRFFRVVHAPIFLRCFATDRRHMKDPDGSWLAQPPAYDPISAEDGTLHNLNDYIEITAANAASKADDNEIDALYSNRLGVVISENLLEEIFSKPV